MQTNSAPAFEIRAVFYAYDHNGDVDVDDTETFPLGSVPEGKGDPDAFGLYQDGEWIDDFDTVELAKLHEESMKSGK